jgi:hypothetical protein
MRWRAHSNSSCSDGVYRLGGKEDAECQSAVKIEFLGPGG